MWVSTEIDLALARLVRRYEISKHKFRQTRDAWRHASDGGDTGRPMPERRVFFGNLHKQTWHDDLGHAWSMAPMNVAYRGAWCPNCFRRWIIRDPAGRKRYDVQGQIATIQDPT